MTEQSGFARMLEAYQAAGGTVDQLVARYEESPNAVFWFASQFGVTRAELDTLAELNKLVAELPDPDEVEAMAAKTNRQIARELLAQERAWEAELEEAYKLPEGSTNSQRWPKLLKEYRRAGGTEDEFDSLTHHQLIALGVDPHFFLDELAREEWGEGSGIPFDELDKDTQELIRTAALRKAQSLRKAASA